jgi:hypothetical protein
LPSTAFDRTKNRENPTKRSKKKYKAKSQHKNQNNSRYAVGYRDHPRIEFRKGANNADECRHHAVKGVSIQVCLCRVCCMCMPTVPIHGHAKKESLESLISSWTSRFKKKERRKLGIFGVVVCDKGASLPKNWQKK